MRAIHNSIVVCHSCSSQPN